MQINKVIDKIKMQEQIPYEQINCIWYCLDGAELKESEKKYIDLLISSLNNNKHNFPKIPIIFVYIQDSKENNHNINDLENNLKSVEYYKLNPDNFHYINIFNPEKGLNHKDLLEKTIDIIKNELSLPILQKENTMLEKIYIIGNIILVNLEKINDTIIKNILDSSHSHLDTIFKEIIPFFKEFIKALGPKNVEKEKEDLNDSYMNKIIEYMEFIIKDKLTIALNEFDQNIFSKSFGPYLFNKLDDKKKEDINAVKENFEYNCKNYLIQSTVTNVKNYAIIALFLEVRTVILNYALTKISENYDLKREKIKEYFKNFINNKIESFKNEILQ